MAGCYHDQEDFQPDMKVEIAKEDEIVKEGKDLDDFNCEKNPRHHDFIPFKDLTLEDLPENHRTMEKLNLIKTRGDLVVRILVYKMVNGKWIKTCGTGYVVKMMHRYCIMTNNHVVKTDEDVRNCTVEFFYDSHDRSKVIESRGRELYMTCPYKDITLFTIHPVHDSIQQLDMINYDPLTPFIVVSDRNNQFVTRMSCPYYESSAGLQFTDININDPNIEIMFLWFKDKSFSYLKSSYFRFQPIPSNIQDITNVDIHVDEDDGNSTMISGDVVKFGDEYIPESIFQDKVKKCRLVWNGKVISRGTRLYFKQMKFFSISTELKFEEQMEQFPKNGWTFDFSPKENDTDRHSEARNEVNRFSNLYCIGHPHGSIKMVTFGIYLGYSFEHFDKKGRHIDQPRDDCRCKQTKCVHYSCKTCPGSSGSQVCPFDGLDYEMGLNHFMGRRKIHLFPNGQYIENINTAWAGKAK